MYKIKIKILLAFILVTSSISQILFMSKTKKKKSELQKN